MTRFRNPRFPRAKECSAITATKPKRSHLGTCPGFAPDSLVQLNKNACPVLKPGRAFATKAAYSIVRRSEWRGAIPGSSYRSGNARKDKTRRPVPLEQNQRPSATIGSSCYRFVHPCRRCGAKTASLLTCDLEGFKNPPASASYLLTGSPQWRPFGQTANGRVRSRPLTHSSGRVAESFSSFIPGSVPIFGPRPGITRLQMRMKL